MLIQKLSWDSDFLHFPVGSIRSGTFDVRAFEKEKNNFQLVYIFEYPGSERIEEIEQICGPPADIKVTYQKKITEPVTMPSGINAYTEKEPDAQLVALGLQSGIYSRFKTDTRFPPQTFERLYTEWIRKSADGTLAREVLVHRENSGKISGFVTLELKGPAMHIGLIAVDESSRGKGIGKQLVRAAMFHTQQANFLSLNVATQAINREACRLYEACGFNVSDTVHIYHYWKK